MAFATIDSLRSGLHAAHSEEYLAKYMHRVPPAPVVDRDKFLLDSAEGKVVLDIGASGPMHLALVKKAKKVYGIDRVDADGIVGIDLDDFHATLPVYPDVELIICGEILEHLSNPGWLLKRLRVAYPTTRLVVTVPNAFNSMCRPALSKGIENVNSDHVAWYSYTTLTNLLKREGWIVEVFAWYKGDPYFSEGLIAVTEGTDISPLPHPV